MAYRLLALDLDGTLLNSQGKVGARDAEALQALAAKGVMVAPATARWYQAARRPFDQLGIGVAAIASAGADVRLADGSVVEQRTISRDCATFLGELCDREGWTATLSVPGTTYTRANDLPPWAANAPEWLQPVTHLRDADLSALLSVLVETHGSDAGLAELDRWRDKLEMSTAVSFAGGVLHTLTAKGVDKGSGLRSLCAAARIDPSEAVAVGDSAVDLPMFAAAGCAVAMGNSTPDALAAASMVVATADEGGVAEAIERLWG